MNSQYDFYSFFECQELKEYLITKAFEAFFVKFYGSLTEIIWSMKKQNGRKKGRKFLMKHKKAILSH